MNDDWPNVLNVLIEGSDTTTPAKKIKFEPMYGACEYETDLGERFFIEDKYFYECKSNNKPPEIPMEVIIHRTKTLAKLEWAQNILNRQNKEKKSGLILPDGFKV